jgi:hypothetical protein
LLNRPGSKSIKTESRDWRAIKQGFGSGAGEEWSGKSGDKSRAVRTLRVDSAAPNLDKGSVLIVSTRVAKPKTEPEKKMTFVWNNITVGTDPFIYSFLR